MHVYRSLDSPSNSTETVNDVISHPQRAHQNDDSDFEVESELPPLDAFIPKDVLRKLKPKEKKRQEVINGKRSFVRSKKIMNHVFNKISMGIIISLIIYTYIHNIQITSPYINIFHYKCFIMIKLIVMPKKLF